MNPTPNDRPEHITAFLLDNLKRTVIQLLADNVVQQEGEEALMSRFEEIAEFATAVAKRFHTNYLKALEHEDFLKRISVEEDAQEKKQRIVKGGLGILKK